jgi:hypothetical protein
MLNNFKRKTDDTSNKENVDAKKFKASSLAGGLKVCDSSFNIKSEKNVLIFHTGDQEFRK